MSVLQCLLTEAQLSEDVAQSVLSLSDIEQDFAEHASGLNLEVYVYDEQVDDYVYSHERTTDLIDLLVLYWAQANQARTEYSVLVDRCVEMYGKDAINKRAWEYV